ncbi:hypothetical protein HPB51_018351 [Rhipicephalus microplus]|uniref:Integrator complex subunit 7 n=1 Tax=Rhipicephalus microplus TaxID=6941 RepID=A0A9J6EUH5_RHIMP|nr:hypothetical protein HPB51_018351 [Rhipicephalus microplus]
MLNLNTGKCAILVFPIKDPVHISINYKLQDIPQVQSLKYLGVMYNEHLNWRPHIEYIATKAVRAMGVLRRLSNCRSGMRRKALLIIYKMYVRPVLEFGCILFSGAPAYKLRPLVLLEREALRLCLGLPKIRRKIQINNAKTHSKANCRGGVQQGDISGTSGCSEALTSYSTWTRWRLRSGRLGEQCETIVRFPRLFEKYPFPILINSACLKLAEVFRVGSNFLRMLVLKVVQQSERHLDKVLNIDEFVRRIFSVMYSNDPVARALTLRTLGSIAAIVAERKDLHHSIRSSLESHDAVEQEAAIFAAARFAAQSKAFAANMCARIGQMIQGLATPVDTKLRLLGVLEGLHQDAPTAALVRDECLHRLLPRYPSQSLVQATLRVLTRLAAATVTHIPSQARPLYLPLCICCGNQIGTLVEYLRDDPREGVKAQALDDLCLLATEQPHLWDTDNVHAVVQYALSTPYLNLKCGALSVLVLLAQSVAVDKFDLMPDGPVLQLCREGIFHHQVRLASASIRLLTHLAIHAAREDLLDLMPEVSSAIETLLMILCTQESESDDASHALRGCLRCIVLLCDADSDLCSQFVDVLGSFLSFWSGAAMLSVCEGLCALGKPAVWGAEPHRAPHPAASQHGQQGCHASHSSQGIGEHAVNSKQEWRGVPFPYPGRRFGRHGCLERLQNCAAGHSLRTLCGCCTSFLQPCQQGELGAAALLAGEPGELCRAEESLLVRKGQMQLTDALTHYVRAISALKAATTPAHALQFQAEYVRLRCEGVRAHAQLLQACSCLRTAPPPAIAASVASATRDELQKCGRVVAQLRKCSRDFKSLADQYGVLYQTLFDADPGTLRNVQLYP